MTRFILIFILVVSILFNIPFINCSIQQSESQILINTQFFPYIYIKLNNNNLNDFIKSVKVDEKEITNYEFIQFSDPKNKKLIPVLLIENSKNMVNSGYDTQTMNLLLRMKASLPEKENTVAFTFSSELERIKGSILTVNFSNDSNARLIDSLILVTNIIKNIDGYPFIILIGTGEDRGSKAEKFFPTYPIVYIDVKNNPIVKEEIKQIANLSSGFSINLSDVFDYYQIEERVKKNLNTSNLLLLFKTPFRYNLFKKHSITLELINGQKYVEKFNISGFPIIIPRLIILLLLVGAGYYIYITLKKNPRKVQKKPLYNNTRIGWLEVYLKNEKKNVIIDNKEFMIGSRDICNLQIYDFEISALHCIIKEVEKGFELIDLNSRYGVYVNSLRISSKLLENDDVIKIGSTLMIFKEREINN